MRVIVIAIGAGVIFSVGVANEDIAFQSLQKIVAVDRYAVALCLTCRTAGYFFLPVNIFAADKPSFAEKPCDVG